MPNVTVNGASDIISCASTNEALGILKSISRNTDAGADEIAKVVSFSGLSLKDTAVVYSAFMKEEKGATVIQYEERKKKKVPCQLHLLCGREAA